MIYFYSGTPGSGKSLHVASDIAIKLCIKKQPVIATFPINIDYLSKKGKKKIGKFSYVDYEHMSVDFLMQYAKENHVMGKEAQTLVILDECQIMFNPREYDRKDRLKWITFFTQHRKLGYNFILISQFDRLIDRQIRALFEYEVKHRKVNNFGIGAFLPVPAFVAVNYWYGVRERISCDFFIYKRKYSKIYDSYMFFDESIKDFKSDAAEQPVVVDVGGTRARGGPTSAITGKLKNIQSKIFIFLKSRKEDMNKKLGAVTQYIKKISQNRSPELTDKKKNILEKTLTFFKFRREDIVKNLEDIRP